MSGQVLEVGCNLLTSLPASLCSLPSLLSLGLSSLLLSHLPEDLGRLATLQSLEVTLMHC